jgi:hypothetical protein
VKEVYFIIHKTVKDQEEANSDTHSDPRAVILTSECIPAVLHDNLNSIPSSSKSPLMDTNMKMADNKSLSSTGFSSLFPSLKHFTIDRINKYPKANEESAVASESDQHFPLAL